MECIKRLEMRILFGLILALLPISVGLSLKYYSLVESDKALLPLPGPESLRELIGQVSPEMNLSLELVYIPEMETDTGIARVYQARGDGRPSPVRQPHRV